MRVVHIVRLSRIDGGVWVRGRRYARHLRGRWPAWSDNLVSFGETETFET